MTVSPLQMPGPARSPAPRPLRALLDDVAGMLARFVAFPAAADGEGEFPAALWAVSLWAAHSHAVGSFESTPRLALLSPEKGSGKTRTLEVLELLCPTARHAVNMTAAALFRAVAANQPTLLFDEADTVFGPRASGDHEELRGLINAGHRRGAVAYRCVGEPAKMEVKEFPAFCAVALAGIGDLPDTILDRSVLVRMRRRAPGEHVDAFRIRKVTPPAKRLRDELAGWAKRNAEGLAGAEPDMPAGIADRAADVWEPLLVVADAAGGEWPERARRAAVALNAARQAADVSFGVRLLGDTRTVFDRAGRDRLSSAELVEALVSMEESPWGDLRGRALDARGLAARLRRYEIRPRLLRIGDGPVRGYDRADFVDPWARYLPASAEKPLQPLPPLQHGSGALHRYDPLRETPPLNSPVTPVTDVTLFQGSERQDPPGVTDPPADSRYAASPDRYTTTLEHLPVDQIHACRHCRSTTVTRDRHGPICPPCHNQPPHERTSR